MKPAKLFADGQELLIDKRIGKGGEGEVFAISNMPGYAVKAYLPGIVAEREKKIRAMIGTRLADSAPMVAFPNQVVVDGRGAFVGFVMRLVEKHKEIHELQTPSSRQKHFPKVDYGFIVRVGLNISRVFAQVHATGCVIGDINQRGILVSHNATVALIDADSFQVSDGAQRYLCVVGVPEYTPPELQGRSLKSVVRSTDHDAFGLAVCLFQLLCMDRHPFSGRYSGSGDMPLEKAIAEFRFAYSSRNTGMTPPPGTVRLNDLTPGVAWLFEEAFASTQVGKRPSATMWIEALTELEAALRPCGRNKLHRYARNAAECPWCRMEAEYGRPLFIDTNLGSVHIPNGRIDPAGGFVLDIPALMAAINGVALPASIAVPPPQVPSMPQPSPAAIDVLSKKQMGPLWKIGGLGALAGAGYSLVSGIPGIVALIAAGLGVWMLFRSSSPEDAITATYRQRAGAVEDRIKHLQNTAPIDGAIRKKAEALQAIDEFKRLATAFASVRNDYDKLRKQKQLDDHLSRFTIRGAHIDRVNSGDIAQLASYGFTTAFDAKRRDVQQVHGIGPVKGANFAAWIRHVEAKFQFHAAYTPQDQQNIQKAQNEIITKQQGLEERIKKTVDEFRQEAQGFERWKATRDPELVRLAQQLAQAEVDLKHVGVPVPSRSAIPPAPVPSVSAFPQNARATSTGTAFGGGRRASPNPHRTQPHAASCPKCGGAMIRRTARRGANAGNDFWGCARYPSCTGTRSL